MISNVALGELCAHVDQLAVIALAQPLDHALTALQHHVRLRLHGTQA